MGPCRLPAPGVRQAAAALMYPRLVLRRAANRVADALSNLAMDGGGWEGLRDLGVAPRAHLQSAVFCGAAPWRAHGHVCSLSRPCARARAARGWTAS
jgi:hypothetical protein